jgi:hypothetical protein
MTPTHRVGLGVVGDPPDRQFLRFEMDELFFGIDALRECVNEYMRVVADAGGGRYWFYYC